jgi:hypothetical protein
MVHTKVLCCDLFEELWHEEKNTLDECGVCNHSDLTSCRQKFCLFTILTDARLSSLSTTFTFIHQAVRPRSLLKY